ncbi:uncharacterized protein RHOBADRAFT_41166 [Rhodotorula graminis WP1]|uniref:Ribosome maturation protein SDO1/SBDS N-terminal domain-containing protein n=1 Tax=Rhodotorula graminis (strain WP1) TaxID=578459 RepID=A0A194SDF3_RHOGW|nr:uncharacterized protein RHOBADRAFT_41166 [Rhodotorula graminis WP1]KPV78622.1 hypothetical protein RHOBADRAFT_41166 [Rhodotorula graminis WP1]
MLLASATAGLKSYHKAVYKPDSQSTDEWIIIVGDVAAAEKWKGGDRYVSPSSSSIPLVDIVDSFDVFHTGQGSQGILARPSKQELDAVFETTKEDEIVEIILTKGQIKSGDTPHQWTGKNDSKSGGYQTSLGSGKSGHGGGR